MVDKAVEIFSKSLEFRDSTNVGLIEADFPLPKLS